MRKTIALVLLMLTQTLALFASPSWVGVQLARWSQDHTITSTYNSASLTQSTHSKGSALIFSGSYYPETYSQFGLGFQLGALHTEQKRVDATTYGDLPLSWSATLLSQYRTANSSLVDLEIGTGLLYRIEKEESSTGSSLDITTLSVMSSTTLTIQLTNNLLCIVSADIASPLWTKGLYKIGNTSWDIAMHSRGFFFQTRVGLALSL